VHLIEFDDSSDEVRLSALLSSTFPIVFQVICQRVYSHKAQVLDIIASPTSTQQFLSVHAGDDGAHGCTLWSMQDLHSTVVMTLTSPLEVLATFPDALAGDLIRTVASNHECHSIVLQLILNARIKILFTALGCLVSLRMQWLLAACGKLPKVFCNFLLCYHASHTAFIVSMKSVRTCAHIAADPLHGDVLYVRQSHNICCTCSTVYHVPN
jgi:hypothetical protein